jgi:hypothetical protein
MIYNNIANNNLLCYYISFMNYGSASRVPFGKSSKLEYDEPYYNHRVEQSASIADYRLDPHHIKNCSSCLPTFGPRSSSHGVSTVTGNTLTPRHDLVDVESILTNRNVPMSKSRDGKVNPINVTKFGLKHAQICNQFLDPVNSRLTNPSKTYRGMSINRFHDLQTNPQNVIFHDIFSNTTLEAKDNHIERVPTMMDPYVVYPDEQIDETLPCSDPQICPFQENAYGK